MSNDTEQVAELVEQGFGALESDEIELAFECGNKLKELKHTSAFEILALAHAANEELDQAVVVLQEGVEIAPDVWLLWQLLGNYQSELEQFDPAMASYAKALTCPEANLSSVRYNHGVVLAKSGQHEEALALLDQVEDQELIQLALLARLSSLVELERVQEAIELCESSLALKDYDEEPNEVAELKSELASILWFSNSDRDAALELLWEALDFDKHCESAQWLLRELTGRRSADAKAFRILIQGDWMQPDQDGGPVSFYTNYTVIAESSDEAFKLATFFEPEEIRSSLALAESEALSDEPESPTGVYETTGYSFFPRGSE